MINITPTWPDVSVITRNNDTRISTIVRTCVEGTWFRVKVVEYFTWTEVGGIGEYLESSWNRFNNSVSMVQNFYRPIGAEDSFGTPSEYIDEDQRDEKTRLAAINEARLSP